MSTVALAHASAFSTGPYATHFEVAHIVGGRTVLITPIPGDPVLHWTSSSDGVSWSGPAALPGGPTETQLQAATWNDHTLTLWYVNPSGGPVLWMADYDDGADTFSSQRLVHLATVPEPSSGTTALDVAGDGTRWYLFYSVRLGLSRTVLAFAQVGLDGTLQNNLRLSLLPAASPSSMAVRQVGSFIYLIWYDIMRGAVVLLPTVLAGGVVSYNPGALETVHVSSDAVSVDVLPQGGGALTFILQDEALLVARRRGAANTYSPQTPLADGLDSAEQFRVASDDDTGDIYVHYVSNANQPAGEIFTVRRAAGTWVRPAIAAGGDDAGYHSIRSSRHFTGGASPLAYLKGTDTSDAELDSGETSAASAPLAPRVTSPRGTITEIVPRVAWQYQNPVPGDDQSAWEAIVHDSTVNVTVWDSGTVSGSNGSLSNVGYGEFGAAATALTYGHSYTLRVRTKDSLSGGGAGSWGPWSAAALFTLVRGATVTITDALVGNPPTDVTTPPVSITSHHIQLVGSYVHPDAHASDAFRITVLGPDGNTPLFQSTWRSFAALVLSGANWDTGVQDIPLAPGAHGTILVSLRDASTGVASDSDQWAVTVDYVPPDAPVVVDVTADADQGHLQITVADPAMLAFQWRRYRQSGTPEEWTDLPDPSGDGPWTQVLLYPCAEWDYDIRVRASDDQGVDSAWTQIDRARLPMRQGKYAFWINDLGDPETYRAAVGGVESWDNMQQKRNLDVTTWLGAGATIPRHIFGTSAYWTMEQLHFWINDVDAESLPVAFGEDTVLALQTMVDRRAPVYVRSPRGEHFVMVFTAYLDQPQEAVHFSADFTLEQASPDPGTRKIPVVGVPVLEL